MERDLEVTEGSVIEYKIAGFETVRRKGKVVAVSDSGLSVLVAAGDPGGKLFHVVLAEEIIGPAFSGDEVSDPVLARYRRVLADARDRVANAAQVLETPRLLESGDSGVSEYALEPVGRAVKLLAEALGLLDSIRLDA